MLNLNISKFEQYNMQYQTIFPYPIMTMVKSRMFQEFLR